MILAATKTTECDISVSLLCIYGDTQLVAATLRISLIYELTFDIMPTDFEKEWIRIVICNIDFITVIMCSNNCTILAVKCHDCKINVINVFC